MKPDHDLAYRLQMEEAVTASLYLHPSSSSSSSRKQPPTTAFKRRKVEKERMDRINDAKFSQTSSQISDTNWEPSGDQVRMPSDEGLVNNETCRVGINADITYQSVEFICSEPRVSVYPNFLSKEECEHLIDLAKPHMERCLVRDGETGKYSIDNSRTSSGAYVKRGHDKIIMDIENRIAEWTSIPASHGENLYVLHYKVGEKFESHYDYFVDEFNKQNGGQRIATVLMYLSNVKEGGETIFPIAKWSKGAGPYWDKLPTYGKRGLLVKPKMGDAVLLWNVKPNGDVDPLTYHGGCPVIQGNKWACTKFLRANEFRV